jgi:hypothetical protein
MRVSSKGFLGIRKSKYSLVMTGPYYTILAKNANAIHFGSVSAKYEHALP